MNEQIIDEDFNEFIHHVLDADIPIPRRYVRERENPMELFSAEEFRVRYRFSKETVRDTILPLVSPENIHLRGLPLPPMLKVLTCLRFYATGSFQVVCGDLSNVSQPSVSRLIRIVSTEIVSHLREWIKTPRTEQETADYQQRFYAVRQFPGVTGCIDCTHVPIMSPGGDNAEGFRNRKGWFSLNVQVVVGPSMEILDIVTRWPGSTHDARIFHNSRLKLMLERRELKGILLGDRGYPQLPYLYTPLANPMTAPERRYNVAHIATRCIVERTFGVWKRRFPCLSIKLRTKLLTTAKIISACAILHNIAIFQRDVLLDMVPNIAVNDVPVVAANMRNRRGAAERAAFIQRHFGQVQ